MSIERNLRMLANAATALRPVLGDEMVFVGGVTIGLLIPADRASAVRATTDVDVVVPIANRRAYYAMEDALRRAGLNHGMAAEDPLCRWYSDDLAIDIMPIDAALLGFSTGSTSAATSAPNHTSSPTAAMFES